MLYITLKTVHLLSVIVWLGGMAFAHFFLLSVTTLEPVALVGLVGAIGMLVCSPLRFLVDGAARVVDPIVRGEAGEDLFGIFLKDYRKSSW